MSRALLSNIPFMSNLRHLDAVQRLDLLRRCLNIMPVADSSTMMNKLTIATTASLDHDCFTWILSVGGATEQSQHLESIQSIGTSVE